MSGGAQAPLERPGAGQTAKTAGGTGEPCETERSTAGQAGNPPKMSVSTVSAPVDGSVPEPSLTEAPVPSEAAVEEQPTRGEDERVNASTDSGACALRAPQVSEEQGVGPLTRDDAATADRSSGEAMGARARAPVVGPSEDTAPPLGDPPPASDVETPGPAKHAQDVTRVSAPAATGGGPARRPATAGAPACANRGEVADSARATAASESPPHPAPTESGAGKGGGILIGVTGAQGSSKDNPIPLSALMGLHVRTDEMRAGFVGFQHLLKDFERSHGLAPTLKVFVDAAAGIVRAIGPEPGRQVRGIRCDAGGGAAARLRAQVENLEAKVHFEEQHARQLQAAVQRSEQHASFLQGQVGHAQAQAADAEQRAAAARRQAEDAWRQLRRAEDELRDRRRHDLRRGRDDHEPENERPWQRRRRDGDGFGGGPNGGGQPAGWAN